jgi:hypothetical protein
MPRTAYKEHQCEKCGKVCSTPQSKYSHKKRCKGPPLPPPETETTLLLRSLQREMCELRAQLSAMQCSTTVHNTTNVTNNSTTNNVTNNNVTINGFRREDLSFLAHEIVKDLVKNKTQTELFASLQTLIQLIHFNPNHPENMNVYIQDAAKNLAFCWEKQGWKLYDTEDLARRVILHVASIMCEHVDEPFEKEYSDKDAATFDSFYQNVGNETGHVQGTIETLAKHSRLVDDIRPVPVPACN